MNRYEKQFKKEVCKKCLYISEKDCSAMQIVCEHKWLIKKVRRYKKALKTISQTRTYSLNLRIIAEKALNENRKR